MREQHLAKGREGWERRVAVAVGVERQDGRAGRGGDEEGLDGFGENGVQDRAELRIDRRVDNGSVKTFGEVHW